MTSGLTVRRFDEATAMQWLGGGGVTREILRDPPSGGEFAWRISVAEVQTAGPFSALPGVERTLIFCDGPAMTLTIDGRELALERWTPVHFDGAADVTCDVPSGPTRDLNVMTARGAASAEVSVIDGDHHRLAAPSGRETVVVVLDGEATLAGDGSDARPLAQFDAVHLAAETEVDFLGHVRLALVVLDVRAGRP